MNEEITTAIFNQFTLEVNHVPQLLVLVITEHLEKCFLDIHLIHLRGSSCSSLAVLYAGELITQGVGLFNVLTFAMILCSHARDS